MGEPDATVFHRYAEYLWRKAGGIVLRWTLVGAALGAVLGAVMLTSWAKWPVPHREAYLLVVLGAVSGAVLGRSLAKSRALGLLLQAQLAQHQLEFERSTLARVAAAEAQAVEDVAPALEPAPARAPYVPVGAPVLAADPGEVVPLSLPAPESYGWAAFDPTA